MTALLAKITNMLALDMTVVMIICLCACALVGALTGLIVYRASKKSDVKKEDKGSATSAGEQNADTQQVKVEVANADGMVMARNVIYSAGINGQLKAGEYELKNADSTTTKFNVRLNGLVREYVNGDVIVLADGDTVSAVSGSVIISFVEE